MARSDLVVGQRGDGARLRDGDHRAVGVVGVRARAEPDRGQVGLVGQRQVSQQAGGPVDAEDQQAGGHRVQGAGVPDPPGTEELADRGDNVVRRAAGGLVDQQQSAGGRRPAVLSHRWSALGRAVAESRGRTSAPRRPPAPAAPGGRPQHRRTRPQQPDRHPPDAERGQHRDRQQRPPVGVQRVHRRARFEPVQHLADREDTHHRAAEAADVDQAGGGRDPVPRVVVAGQHEARPPDAGPPTESTTMTTTTTGGRRPAARPHRSAPASRSGQATRPRARAALRMARSAAEQRADDQVGRQRRRRPAAAAARTPGGRVARVPGSGTGTPRARRTPSARPWSTGGSRSRAGRPACRQALRTSLQHPAAADRTDAPVPRRRV